MTLKKLIRKKTLSAKRKSSPLLMAWSECIGIKAGLDSCLFVGEVVAGRVRVKPEVV
jgi:hypothetical protein